MSRDKLRNALEELNVLELITYENKTLSDILEAYKEKTGEKITVAILNKNIAEIYNFKWVHNKWKALKNESNSELAYLHITNDCNDRDYASDGVNLDRDSKQEFILCDKANPNMNKNSIPLNSEVNLIREISGNKREKTSYGNKELILLLKNDIIPLLKEIRDAVGNFNKNSEQLKKDIKVLDTDDQVKCSVNNSMCGTATESLTNSTINITIKELISLLTANRESINININK